MKLCIDLNTFTFGDMIDLEEAGGSLANMQSAKSIVALVWLTRRREDPTFTIDDAKKLSVGEVEIEVAEESADPKDGGSLSSVAVA